MRHETIPNRTSLMNRVAVLRDRLDVPEHRARLAEFLVWICGFGLLGCATLWWMWVNKFTPGLGFAWEQLWWDLRVHDAAIRILSAGGDPYDNVMIGALSRTDLSHLMPPAANAILRLFSASPIQPVLTPLLGAACVIGFFVTFICLDRLLFGPPDLGRLLLGFGVSLTIFNCAGVQALLGGNMGTIFHTLIVLAMARGLTSNRWEIFHVLVVMTSIFKPFYAMYWMVPALSHGWSWRQIAIGTAGTLIAASTFVAGALLAPDDHAAWIRNFNEITFGPLRWTGESAFGGASVVLDGVWPYFLHIVITVCLVALLARFPLSDQKMHWAALISVAVILNPRVNHYDEIVAAIPMLALTAFLLPSRLLMNERLCAAAFVLVGTGMLHKEDSPLFAWAIVLQVIIVVVLACIWDRTRAPEPPLKLAAK
jgi:hypothetical protein